MSFAGAVWLVHCQWNLHCCNQLVRQGSFSWLYEIWSLKLWIYIPKMSWSKQWKCSIWVKKWNILALGYFCVRHCYSMPSLFLKTEVDLYPASFMHSMLELRRDISTHFFSIWFKLPGEVAVYWIQHILIFFVIPPYLMSKGGMQLYLIHL